MAEDFQLGGVCGGTWWSHNLYSGSCGAVGDLSTSCLVAQLDGGYDIGGFGWPNEILKGQFNNQVCENNSLFFPADIDCTLDILGIDLSPTYWNQQNFCKSGSNEEIVESLVQDNLINTQEMKSSSFSNNINTNQDRSPPMTLSNSSGDSSALTCEGGSNGGLNPSFAMSPSASFLIQTLFDEDVSQLMPQVINPIDFAPLNKLNYESTSPCSWVNSTPSDALPIQAQPQAPLQLLQYEKAANVQGNTAAADLSNIRASLMNSFQSRSRTSAYKPKTHNHVNKRNHEETQQESKKNMSKSNNDQSTAKRPRIETPSSLPTFKVRKEKLGDRITALQQLVSPFGKTDTASVLHEAIEYIKFLNEQVQVLCNPYLNNESAVQHQQVSDKSEDLRSRGLCLVPITSTYPIAQETPVDFWTPTTFGGTTFM